MKCSRCGIDTNFGIHLKDEYLCMDCYMKIDKFSNISQKIIMQVLNNIEFEEVLERIPQEKKTRSRSGYW